VCIILDANCFGDFRDKSNEDMKPIHRWLARRNGKIAFSNTERFKREWRNSGMNYGELSRAGRLRLVPENDVLKKQHELVGQLESDDPHVIALAVVARIGLLVVQRQLDEPLRGGRRRARGADTALMRDFKRIARGRVYVTASHRHLLTNDLCP